MKKTLLALAAASLAMPAAPAMARHHHHTTRHYYTASNGVRYWRGSGGRYYCHRGDGTVGTIVGAGGGALVGSAVGGGRAVPTILGGVAGALVGRSIGRHHVTCR